MSHSSCLSWYALQVRPLKEKISAALLCGKGYECFLPLAKKNAANSGAPLFPGYLFCRFDMTDRRAPVMSTAGVVRIIGYGKSPATIPDAEIESLRSVVQKSQDWLKEESLHQGKRVRIAHGAFAGVEGVLSQSKTGRLVVQVMLLGKGVSLPIDSGSVIPAGA